MKMKSTLLVAAGLFIAATSQAQFHDRSDIKRDGNELFHDRADVYRDGKNMYADKHYGNFHELRHDRRKFKRDRRELRHDRRHLRFERKHFYDGGHTHF